MLDWLLQKRQTPRAIDRFWRQVLVSAVNEELERMAAVHGFRVFWLGFLARADSYEMGVPSVPLGELYSTGAWKAMSGVRLHLRSAVEGIEEGGMVVAGERVRGDYSICALPFERLEAVGWPAPPFEHSPITGVHLWFDREDDHAAVRGAAGGDHAVDVQQGRRAVSAIGGERVAGAYGAFAGRDCGNGHGRFAEVLSAGWARPGW